MGEHNKKIEPDEVPAPIEITDDMNDLQRIEAEQHNEAVTRLLTVKTKYKDRIKSNQLHLDLSKLTWK
jgi:hypothetical protein